MLVSFGLRSRISQRSVTQSTRVVGLVRSVRAASSTDLSAEW